MFNCSKSNIQFKCEKFCITTDSIGTGGNDAVSFDLFIEHTNVGVSGPFEFALGQYYFNIDATSMVNSTDYNYYIIPGSTGFSNPNAIPRNPTIVNPDATSPTGASLRVNSNTVLGAGAGPIVSTVFPGTRVCTMKVKKKVGSFPIVKVTWNGEKHYQIHSQRFSLM
ncbi:MAG: hypothetical protein IPG09_10230 [Ignavibacteria bacterium]|nr:hypothetical protein [Ignavibacteria bacterium]